MGVGRAPGTDPVTSRAMHPFDAEQFPAQLQELIGLSRGTLPPDHPFRTVRVIPGGVPLPPIWVLGSSGASARFAGSLGVGYSFARHFSPAPPEPAVHAYLESFTPSEQFPEPHVILGVSVICAETDERADYLAGSTDLVWVRYQRGEFGLLPSPEEAAAYEWSAHERAIARAGRSRHFVGTPVFGARPDRRAGAVDLGVRDHRHHDDPRSSGAPKILRVTGAADFQRSQRASLEARRGTRITRGRLSRRWRGTKVPRCERGDPAHCQRKIFSAITKLTAPHTASSASSGQQRRPGRRLPASRRAARR